MSTTSPTHPTPLAFPSLRSIVERMDAGWRWCLGGWITARLILSAWGFWIWATGWIPPNAGEEYWWGVTPVLEGWRGALLGVWLRWDGIYYLRIAAEGYSEARLSAFFPLYPVLSLVASEAMRLEILMGLLLVSNLSMILALVQLYRLAESLYATAVARRVIVATLAFPLAFFFFAPYPQSLALALVLLAYTAARQRHWLLCALAGMAGGLCHGSVIPLSAALAWEAWEQRSEETSPRRGMIAAHLPWLARSVAAATPLIGLAIFLAWRSYAGLPGFDVVQYEYWGRVALWPWQTLTHLWQTLAAGKVYIYTWIDLTAALITLTLTAWALRRLPVSLRIYQVAMLLTLLSTTIQRSPLGSWGRMSLMMFPLYLALGLWTENRRRAMFAFAAGVGLQLFLLTIFFAWGFVG